MSGKHRNILRSKRKDLVRSVLPTHQLLASLESALVINRTMREEILVSGVVLVCVYGMFGGGMVLNIDVSCGVVLACSWDIAPGSCHKLNWF